MLNLTDIRKAARWINEDRWRAYHFLKWYRGDYGQWGSCCPKYKATPPKGFTFNKDEPVFCDDVCYVIWEDYCPCRHEETAPSVSSVARFIYEEVKEVHGDLLRSLSIYV
jgi:hypothetical protein